jgi:hypothetical protein
MKKLPVRSEFLNKNTSRTINREVSYTHGANPSISKHVMGTHFTYDLKTNTLTMIRDMSRFDIAPKEVPESFMGNDFYFVDDNGKTIKTNYHTIRYNFYNYATCSGKQKSNKPYKKKVFSSYAIPGSSFGFSF